MKFLLFSSFAHLVLDRDPTRVSGGAELQMGLLARALAQRGHDVALLGADEGQPDGRVLDGVRTRTGGRFDTGRPVDTLRAFVRVARVLRAERPEWVVIMGAGTWVWLLWLLRLRFGFSLAFIAASDVDVDGGYRRMFPARGWLYELALRRVDRVIAMSEYQRAGFTKRGLRPGFYRNLLLDAAGGESPKDVDFLWVASAQPLKQPGLFLDLAARLPERRFVMICPLKQDRAFWERTRARAAALPNVEFHPLVPYHTVQMFFHRARVFVNTSDYEGFPNTFLQAGLGRAALLSLRVDPDGMIAREGAGVCAQGEPAVFYAAAGRMLDEAAALAGMQARCAEYVAARHGTAANVDAFLEALKP